MSVCKLIVVIIVLRTFPVKHYSYMKKPLIQFSIALIMALGCVACGGRATSVSSAQTARLRVVNGSWYVPGSMNVLVDGTTVASNIPYPMCVNEVCQTLSAYVSVKSGGVDFVVEAAGSTTNLVPQFQKLNLAPNTHNTLIVVGTVSGTPVGGYLFLDDDAPAANSVKLRIAHADPSFAGALAAFVLPHGTPASGTPTSRGEQFLNWDAPEAVNVLYVEGELPAAQVQERWRQIIGPTNGRARLVTIDKQKRKTITSLASPAGMERLEMTVRELESEGFKTEVLFLD